MTSVSRRSVAKTAGATAGTLLVPISTAVADTDSGEIEISTDADVPSATTLEITVYADWNGDGSPDSVETTDVQTGQDTHVLLGLEGASTADYWATVNMTSDGSATPELYSMELALPDTIDDPEEDDGPTENDRQLFGVIGLIPFLFAMISLGGLVGAMSRYMALAGFGAFLTFIVLAIETEVTVLMTIIYVALVAVCLFAGAKIFNYSMGGGEDV